MYMRVRTSKNSEGKADARRKIVKTFTPPKFNFSMEEYSEIINWMDCELSSLVFLAEISDDEIKSQIDND